MTFHSISSSCVSNFGAIVKDPLLPNTPLISKLLRARLGNSTKLNRIIPPLDHSIRFVSLRRYYCLMSVPRPHHVHNSRYVMWLK